MKIVSNGVKYNVEIKGNGVPLLLLHGFTGSLETWFFLESALMDYRLIMVDIIGHGKSESPTDISRYEMATVATDLKHILDKLQVEKTHILGYSMGGRLALSFASLYPEYVRSLILESASPGLPSHEARRQRREQDALLANKIVEDGLIKFVHAWENISLFSTQKRLPERKQLAIRNQRLTNTINGLANSLLGMGTGTQSSYWGKLGLFSFPVLLMTGELDKKFCKIAKEMQLLMKNTDWRIINDIGHAIHVEDEAEFGKIVSEFLDKIKEET